MRILYICTHNRCRSILSEAITNHVAGDVIEAKSAGSAPAGQVHPLSLKYLAEEGIPTENLKSESWNDFENFNPDVVITVCDSAAAETCPLWMGKTVKAHWGLVDPSKIANAGASEEESKAAFQRTIQEITQRVNAIKKFANVTDQEELKKGLREIGAQC